jgi:hypothetical protein
VVACCLFHGGFLLGLLFGPEDGGDICLRIQHIQHYFQEDRNLLVTCFHADIGLFFDPEDEGDMFLRNVG